MAVSCRHAIQLPGVDPRLGRRYAELVGAHLTPAQLLAAGLHPPPSVATPLAAVRAACRFYANPRVSLRRLGRPLVAAARADVGAACERFGLALRLRSGPWTDARPT